MINSRPAVELTREENSTIIIPIHPRSRSGMTSAEILEISLARSNASEAFWTFYIAVVVGIIGYVGATAATTSFGVVRGLLILGFIGVASFNYNGLERQRSQSEDFGKIAIENLEAAKQKNGASQSELNQIKKMVLKYSVEKVMSPFKDGWTKAQVESVIQDDRLDEVLYAPIVVTMDPPDLE